MAEYIEQEIIMKLDDHTMLISRISIKKPDKKTMENLYNPVVGAFVFHCFYF